eukprot:Clim_evm39s146 gene=Clim_evmTU39s146
MASSELFEAYEEEVDDLLRQCEQQFQQNVVNASGERQRQYGRDLERRLNECEDSLNHLEMELKVQPAQHRHRLEERVRSYKQRHQALKSKVANTLVGQGGPGRQPQNRGDLLGLEEQNMGYESPLDRPDDRRQRLVQATDTMNQSSGRILNSQRLAAESEQIGVDILNSLGEQRSTIERTGRHLDEADEELGQASRVLRTMKRRVLGTKVIRYLLIALVLLLIALIIYIAI